MSESTASTASSDVESILRTWANAQAPTRDFASDRVFMFVQPVRHSEGVFFVPGELVLAHPADDEAAADALGRGMARPLAVWSFSLERELMIPPGLVRAERRVSPAPRVEESPAVAK